MATPADRGWGDPGLDHSNTKAREYGRLHVTTIVTSDNSRFAVRRELAPVFQGFLNEIIQRGYRIRGKALDDWGWYVRPIAGTTTPSNHSWGLAVDVNAMTNPMGRVLRTDMPDFVPEAAKRWGLRWGGTYAGKKDAMHFEWVGSRDDALRFTASLRTLQTAGVVSKPTPALEDDMPMTSPVPWMPRIPSGRTPYFELVPIQGANEALVVSHNDAPFDPPWELARDDDEIRDGKWARRMKLPAPATGIFPNEDGRTVTVTCRSSDTYDIARKPA